MWRIYSQNNLGVRLSTSTRKLKQALLSEANKRQYTLRLQEVDYLSRHDMESRINKIKKGLLDGCDPSLALDALFLKRSAFDHESELRVALYCPDATEEQRTEGIKLPVNPYNLIDSILLDPRAPNELYEALAFYFKEELKIRFRVSRSVLYKSPEPITVE